MYQIPKRRLHDITMTCIGCHQPMPVTDLRIKVPVGAAGMLIDRRPKTPTGGRFGAAPDHAVRRFPKFDTGPGCVRCSLKFDCLLPLPKSIARGRR